MLLSIVIQIKITWYRHGPSQYLRRSSPGFYTLFLIVKMFTKILHDHSVRHFGFLCLQSKTSTTWIHIQPNSFTNNCNKTKTRINV